MQRVQRSTLLTAAILAGCALTGAANAQVIRITNVNSPTGHDIPLKANSSVQIDAAGNLLAECALNSSNACEALATGNGGNVPSATLTRIDTDTELTAGETVRLAWTSTNAEACKVSTTGPTSTGFNGVRGTALSGGELVTVGAQGNYVFSLVCYNAAGASTASTVSATVVAGQTQEPGECNITSTDPSFQPTNFAMVERTWTQTFSAPDGDPVATYPRGIAFPGPAPRLSKGQYAVIPITPTADQYVNIYWDQVQAKLGETYTVRPAEGMFFALSPCKGDLRAPVAGSPDHFLRPGCRVFGNSASIQFKTGASLTESNDVLCKLTAGQTYYLHILSANPQGGLATGEHSCENVANSQTGCDVGVKIQSAVVP